MCLEVVIEDQVEGTKFAQEKHIFSIFSACTLIAAWSIEYRGSVKISKAKKHIAYSFEARIKICLNWYLKDIISHLLEGFLDRETLNLCG